MECKLSSNRRRGTAAMTLVEMLVASGVGGLIFVAVANLTTYTTRTFASMMNYTEMDQKSRYTLDQMTSDIRSCDRLANYSSTNLDLVVGGLTNLNYNYDAAGRQMTRTKSGVVKVLLTECDTATFTAFGRGTLSGTFDQFPATNATDAKLIKMDWTCSRQYLGSKVNTESVQSAKVVMRKQ